MKTLHSLISDGANVLRLVQFLSVSAAAEITRPARHAFGWSRFVYAIATAGRVQS